VSNFTYLKIKKGEPGTHESGVITNCKERKKKFQMTARRGNTAKAAPTTRAANQHEINNTTLLPLLNRKSNKDKILVCETSNLLNLHLNESYLDCRALN
jgi:hypothetical protein